MQIRSVIQWTVRLTLLAAALCFVLGGPLPATLVRLVPGLSPLSLMATSLSQRTWYAGYFWLLPPLAVLVMALWRGRFFCRWICPLGTLVLLPARISLKKAVLPFRLNALLFWMILSASLLGVPALLWLDPLSTFNRIGAWREAAAWVPGLVIPAVLLLGVIQPQLWCTQLCPLGYLFDLARLGRIQQTFRRDRRQFMAGIGLGLPAAVLLPGIAAGTARPSVLPPGAMESFAKTCSRCYACVRACPPRIIQIRTRGPLEALYMPELRFERGACEESCNVCTQVCPTGAIRAMPHAQKHRTKIGLAVIEKEKCLAWTDHEYCMVCDEYCPYNAIETHWLGDIACPVITPELCRGCGACEYACPAVRAGKAIRVKPVVPQTLIGE